MSGEGWRNARVRDAEDGLAAAVRAVDDIIAPKPPPPPRPTSEEEPETPTILHDAW